MIADFLKKVSFEFRLNCRWLQLLKVFYMRFKTLNCRLRRHVASGGAGGAYAPSPPILADLKAPPLYYLPPRFLNFATCLLRILEQ